MSLIKSYKKYKFEGVGARDGWFVLRALAVLPEDLDLIPSTHMMAHNYP